MYSIFARASPLKGWCLESECGVCACWAQQRVSLLPRRKGRRPQCVLAPPPAKKCSGALAASAARRAAASSPRRARARPPPPPAASSTACAEA
jgi:hypothetical protein